MVDSYIQDFLSNLDKHSGPAKSERFYVQITPPPGIDNPSFDLQFQCDLAELPGISLEVSKYRFYGPDKNLAVSTQFQEIVIEVVCTNDFYEKPWFDSWVNLINPKEQGWDMNYKSMYTGTVTIFQTDTTGQIIYSVNLINAWPMNVAPMPVRWADDSTHKLSVSFIYDRYEDSSNPLSTLLGGLPGISGLPGIPGIPGLGNIGGLGGNLGAFIG